MLGPESTPLGNASLTLRRKPPQEETPPLFHGSLEPPINDSRHGHSPGIITPPSAPQDIHSIGLQHLAGSVTRVGNATQVLQSGRITIPHCARNRGHTFLNILAQPPGHPHLHTPTRNLQQHKPLRTGLLRNVLRNQTLAQILLPKGKASPGLISLQLLERLPHLLRIARSD